MVAKNMSVPFFPNQELQFVPFKTEVKYNSFCNIYVSNLPMWVDDHWLRSNFSWFGPITSAKVMTKCGKEKAFGFVQFTDPSMAQEAVLVMNGKKVGSCRITVKIADRDKDKGITTIPSNNLYVSNLPSSMNSHDVKMLFSLCGQVSSLIVLHNTQTNTSRGVALVRFCNVSDATNAVDMLCGAVLPGHDRPLEVKYAENDRERNTRKGLKNLDVKGKKDNLESISSKSKYDISALRPFNSNSSQTESASFSTGSNISESEEAQLNYETLCNVYVSNLPKCVTSEWLRGEFSCFGLITSCRVVMKPDKEKAFGFVQYTEPIMAKQAIEAMHGSIVENSRICVKIADRDKDKGVAPNPSTNVYVGNLPSDISTHELKILFSTIGPIGSLISLDTKKNSINNGVALIRFLKLEDAIQAVTIFNRTLLPGHDLPLEVKFAENETDRHLRKGLLSEKNKVLENIERDVVCLLPEIFDKHPEDPLSDPEDNIIVKAGEYFKALKQIETPEIPISRSVNLFIHGDGDSRLFAPFQSFSNRGWCNATDAG